MKSNKGRGPITSRYLAALLAPAVIAGLMQVTWPFFQHSPVLPYLLAVIFCAWYGGLGPGLLSLFISYLLTDFFFIEPYLFFGFPKQLDLVRLLLFAVVGSFISVMSELMHRERRRAEINLESAKRAERSLREKERFANQIAELSPVVINVFDLATRRDVYISPDVVNLLGYTPKEIAEMEDPFSVLWHPEDVPRASENLARFKHARDGEIFEFEYRIRRRDGEWRWVATRGISFARDEHGEVRQIVTATHDITERKRVERAQRESQRQYETLVHSIDGIVWEADPRTFTFTFVSKQAERILGYPLEQWFEGPSFWLDHMDPEDRDWAVAFCLDSTDRRVDHQFEYRMIAADGHVVWLSDIVTVHVVDDQSVLLRGVMVDITERKRFEEKLRQSESQLAEAQRLASVGSWNWEIRNNTYTWSGELYRIYGLHPHESDASYETFIKLVHPDDRAVIKGAIEHALKTQEPINSYHRIIRPDGTERIIHSRGNTISDISGTPIRMHGTMQDVTERRQAEDALHEAERKYRAIFDNAGEGIFQSTPDGRFIAANPALARMYGFAFPEELIHSRQDISRQLYVDPTRREEFKRQIEEQGTVRWFEHQVFRKDGSKIWISVNARVVRDEQGAIRYYEGTAHNITERKRAQEALRESEESYRELFENAKDAIYVQDLAGVYTSVNRAAEKLCGYDRNEIIGKHFDQFVAPEYLPLVCAKFSKKLADQEQTAYEVEVIARDGRRVPVELSSALILKHGVPIGIQGIARDITERKRAEETLRESEKHFRYLIENMLDGFAYCRMLFDDNGSPVDFIYLDVSDVFYKLSGLENVIQRRITEIFPNINELHPEMLEIYGRVALTGKPERFELYFKPLDRWLDISVYSSERGYFVAVFDDITARKRAEETLRSYSRQLIEAQEAERQHIARELHDQIGQVLTAVRINLQTIGNSFETDESQALIDQGVALIDAALEQVRNLSFELRPSLLDNLGLVAALRWYADQHTQRTGIRTKSETNLPGGQTRLSQELETACFRIVQEALTNVVRHAKAKNVSINLRRLDQKILLSIKDDGIGFDELSLNGGASATRLGLRGMKERALALGGTLEIKSAPAQGTEIRACFPTESKGE